MGRERNGAGTGVQRHRLKTGFLQSLPGFRTNRSLFLGRLLQALLQLLPVPLPRLGFDLLFDLQQAELGL